MAGEKSQWQLPPRPEQPEQIRFFETPPLDETRAMAESSTPARGDLVDETPTETVIRDPGASARRDIEGRASPAGPARAAWEGPVRPAADYVGAPVEQLARLEDKTSRIEDKLARSEASTQRVIDRFELASSRMSDVALQADLHAVREDVVRISRRVGSLPGFTALILTSVVTALLTAVIFIAILRYLPTLLPALQAR